MRTRLLVIALSVPSLARAYDCPTDPALEEAAVRLLTEADADGAARTFVRDAGGSMPVVRVLRVGPGDDATVDRWLTAQRAGTEGPVVCGEAVSDEARVVLAAERAGTLVVQGGPDVQVVRATLAPGMTAQYLVFRGADGRFVRVPPTRALGDGEPVPASLPAPVEAQLVAESRRGPRPVAEITLGGEPRADAGDDDARVIARRRGDEAPRERVARLRGEASVSPLRPNRLLDQAAAAYAQEVCAGGRVVHRSATGDGPRERLRARGIDARVVGETIARAQSRAEALAALEGSPSHMATLVDRRFTDGGYGVASDARGRRCVVVVLAAWPRAIVSR